MNNDWLWKPRAKDVNKIDLSGFSVGDLNYFFKEAGQEHYRLLAWISMRLHAQTFMDYGTHSGLSALALSYNQDNSVMTYDIRKRGYMVELPWNVADIITEGGHDFEAIRTTKPPLIFYDTWHDGKIEREFIKGLEAINYKGIVIFDDIHESEVMEDFWNSITQPKEDWTDIGHWSGTGIVYF